MSVIHYYYIPIVVAVIVLYALVLWVWDEFWPALDHDFDKAQDWDFSTDRDCYEDADCAEISDPYLREE